MIRYKLDKDLRFINYLPKGLQKEFYITFGGIVNVFLKKDAKDEFELLKIYHADGMSSRIDALNFDEIKEMMMWSIKVDEDMLLKYCLEKSRE